MSFSRRDCCLLHPLSRQYLDREGLFWILGGWESRYVAVRTPVSLAPHGISPPERRLAPSYSWHLYQGGIATSRRLIILWRSFHFVSLYQRLCSVTNASAYLSFLNPQSHPPHNPTSATCHATIPKTSRYQGLKSPLSYNHGSSTWRR